MPCGGVDSPDLRRGLCHVAHCHRDYGARAGQHLLRVAAALHPGSVVPGEAVHEAGADPLQRYSPRLRRRGPQRLLPRGRILTRRPAPLPTPWPWRRMSQYLRTWRRHYATYRPCLILDAGVFRTGDVNEATSRGVRISGCYFMVIVSLERCDGRGAERRDSRPARDSDGRAPGRRGSRPTRDYYKWR